MKLLLPAQKAALVVEVLVIPLTCEASGQQGHNTAWACKENDAALAHGVSMGHRGATQRGFHKDSNPAWAY
eukprot:1160608-Pelagomonas_calceolata.AAC.5